MDDFKKFTEWLQGKKTHFVMGALMLVGYLHGEEFIGQGLAEILYSVLAPLGGVTLAAKFNRILAAIRGDDVKEPGA